MFRYRGFDIKVPAGVYEPREDTDMLAGAAEKIKSKIVLEMGCGAGIISLILARNKNKVTAVDVDKRAVDATTENAVNNKVDVKCFKSDLFKKVKGKYDYILFNFPYLPEKVTEENVAWAAGEDIEVIRRFARGAKKHLKRRGKVVFVMSSLTNLKKVLDVFAWNGFKTRILAERKIPWEKLYLIEAKLD